MVRIPLNSRLVTLPQMLYRDKLPAVSGKTNEWQTESGCNASCVSALRQISEIIDLALPVNNTEAEPVAARLAKADRVL